MASDFRRHCLSAIEGQYGAAVRLGGRCMRIDALRDGLCGVRASNAPPTWRDEGEQPLVRLT